jgi:hypothetical protein
LAVDASAGQQSSRGGAFGEFNALTVDASAGRAKKLKSTTSESGHFYCGQNADISIEA